MSTEQCQLARQYGIAKTTVTAMLMHSLEAGINFIFLISDYYPWLWHLSSLASSWVHVQSPGMQDDETFYQLIHSCFYNLHR